MSVKDIPYIAYDEALARFERVNKRSFIIIIVLTVLLFLTNGAWIYYESQWSYTTDTTTIEATQEGDNNIVSGGNYYGADGKGNQDQ